MRGIWLRVARFILSELLVICIGKLRTMPEGWLWHVVAGGSVCEYEGVADDGEMIFALEMRITD
jgi:hypothetical protein